MLGGPRGWWSSPLWDPDPSETWMEAKDPQVRELHITCTSVAHSMPNVIAGDLWLPEAHSWLRSFVLSTFHGWRLESF